MRVLSISTGIFEDGDRRQGQNFGQRDEEEEEECDCSEGSPDLFLTVLFLLTSDTLDCAGLEGDETTTDGCCWLVAARFEFSEGELTADPLPEKTQNISIIVKKRKKD